ncbi:MAG TPA: Ig-like domain-containing protein, partial [Candidatus Saccharimonadales bacterium]|nr:Ig-like domain-containing protein [Candidatus Saccharimonadales bacterium]
MSTTGSAGRKRTGRFVPKGAAGALLIGAAGGLLLLAAGMTLSCVNSDPTAPEGSTITVSADPQTVQPGVNSKITATVRSMNGTRLPDQEVIFTTTAGKLSTGSNAVTTDTAGQAESTLSTTQNATVTAASGTVTASTTVTFSTCTLQNFTVVPTP